MNGQGKLLTHFLKNADKLIIPVYQRNYDWREEHCRKLYQDLVRTIQNKKRWHFFGGIVSVSDPMGSSSDYLVIDGQQRITTVSLSPSGKRKTKQSRKPHGVQLPWGLFSSIAAYDACTDRTALRTPAIGRHDPVPCFAVMGRSAWGGKRPVRPFSFRISHRGSGTGGRYSPPE